MERKRHTVVLSYIMLSVIWIGQIQPTIQANSCDMLTVTRVDPAENTIIWSDSAQHCTENWYWTFKNKFPKDSSIVMVINDVYVADDDTFSFFDNTNNYQNNLVNRLTIYNENTAPVLFTRNQAVLQVNTSKRMSKSGYSRFNISLFSHPSNAIPPTVPLVGNTNNMASLDRYNCSSLADIPPGLRCDKVKQCIGGEDEHQCDYLQPGCGDWIPYKDRCLKFVFSFIFVHKTNARYDSTPLIAKEICKNTHHASLAHIPDLEDKAFVAEVTRRSGFQSIVIGLQKVRTTSRRTRRLYRYLWQWGGTGGPIDYREQQIQRDGANDNCAILRVVNVPKILPTPCLHLRERPDGYVCSKPNPLHHHHPTPKFNRTLVLGPPTKILNTFPTKKCADQSAVQTFLPCPSITQNSDMGTFLAEASGNETLAKAEHNLKVVSSGTSETSSAEQSPPELPVFQCHYGESVHYSVTCDGFHDCPDGSDELECEQPRNALLMNTSFICRQTQIIPESLHCNGLLECLDESDEEACSMCNIPQTSVVGLVACPQLGCVPMYYSSYVANCPLMMSFERNLQDLDMAQVTLDGYGMSRLEPLSNSNVCPETHFQCPAGYCIPTFLMNNGEQDCPHGEDEHILSVNLICPGFYRCRKIWNCIHPDHVCDGLSQCPFADDELFCDFTCPANCTCQGFAFTCSVMFNVYQHLQVRYLDLSGVADPPLAGLNDLDYLHFLNLSSCHLHSITLKDLHHLRVLDLSRNIFMNLSSLRLENLGRLQYLDLSHNPLMQELDSAFSALISSAAFLQLETLALMNTAMKHLQAGVLSLLPQLASLDLRGSPIDQFDIQVFRGLNKLRVLRTDNSKLCCSLPELSVAHCEAPVDELSSCDDLLSSDFFRVFLWTMSLLAITGNAGVFLYRLIKERNPKGKAFPVLVQNLCLADLLMGVYLLIIGVADSQYRGLYFTRDTLWRHSTACQAAGFLALLSSEVSAFILCLITLDRLLVVCFPLHTHLHLTTTSSLFACLSVWGAGLLLAATPLLPPAAHWQFYSQTGICLPLPITRHYFPGQGYTLAVFVILNFLLFLIVGVGQVVIFRAIQKAGRVATGSQRQQQEMSLAKRLFLVAFSDFCCWFPIGIMGLLAAGGMAIPGEVNVWAAVFVLPVNSALNPFLYTLNALLYRYTRRRQEQKIERLIKRLHVEIDRWPADRVEDLVQHCLRKKLAGRELTPCTKGESTNDKMANSGEGRYDHVPEQTLTTSLSLDPTTLEDI